MASSAPAASGVTISGALGGGLTAGAAPSGLDGLFSALLGGGAGMTALPGSTGLAGALDAADLTAPTGNAPTTDGMISVLLGSKSSSDVLAADLTSDDASGVKVSNLTTLLTPQGETAQVDVQVGDGPVLTVSGDAETLKAFVAQLKDIYQQVVNAGGLTMDQMSDSKELAGALTKLGMSPEDAQGVAERIQTMLKLLEQQQDLSDEAAGSLATMMLAIMGQQAGVAVPPETDTTATADTAATTQAIGLQIMSVATPATSGGAKTSALQMRMGGDVTRDLLGFGKADTKAADDVATDKGRKVELTVTADADTTIGMALPDVKAVAQTVRDAPLIDAQPSVAAQTAAAVTTTGAAVKVAADERIEAPKGDTYYKLQADKNGVETLEAVKPMAEVKDQTGFAAQTQQAQTQAALAATPGAEAAAGSAFAERVAQIQDMVEKADVGKQVAVQMQPLLDQGGGKVRINLHPKDLGQITVDLTVADGKVHGAIAASDPAVVEQLARELHSLRHGLADAGLKLGEQGINLMLSNSNQQGNQQGQQGQNGSHAQNGRGFGQGSSAAGDTDGEALASSLSSWVSPDRVLDVNV